MGFTIVCNGCGELAVFKDGNGKSKENIDIIVLWDGTEIEIWCDTCNIFIELN